MEQLQQANKIKKQINILTAISETILDDIESKLDKVIVKKIRLAISEIRKLGE